MIKTDLVKEDKAYYTAKVNPELREFNNLNYISILGVGEPAGIHFTNAVEALYPLAYAIRSIYKAKELIFSVPKLEGLWWVNSDKNALEVPKNEWHWKLLIRMPDFVRKEEVEIAKSIVIKKKGISLVNQIEFEILNESQCVQIMHVGPYSTEPDTLKKMKEFMDSLGLTENGLHHEIYLSDPRKTCPEKMKTIIRQPVK